MISDLDKQTSHFINSIIKDINLHTTKRNLFFNAKVTIKRANNPLTFKARGLFVYYISHIFNLYTHKLK